jgi:hypothetical protein
MMKYRFKVIRGFRSGGDSHDAGDLVELDPKTAADLMGSGKIVPADSQTREAFEARPTAEWGEVPPHLQPQNALRI